MGTTLQERLDWLEEAREADADLGFPGRMLALCSLPTDQGKRSHFVRTNGPFTLAMTAVGTPRLLHGNLPRLLLALTWKQVYVQHGPFPETASDNVTVHAFRKKCLRELMKIQRAWPELNYATERGRLILRPTPAQIPPGRKPNAYA